MTAKQKQQIVDDIKTVLAPDSHKLHKDSVSFNFKHFGSAYCEMLLEYCQSRNLSFTFNAHWAKVITLNIY